MCTSKPKTVPLPEQHTLCSTPNSGCRYVEVKAGKKGWEKRTAILVRPDGDSDQKLYIYTKPLIGQSLPLNELKTCEAKRTKSGEIVLKLATEKQKLTFKISGNDAGLWVAAIMSCSQATLTHETHSPINDGSASNAVPNIKDEPENANFTGSREGYVLPVQEGSLSEEKKKQEEKNRNNNDPPKDHAQKSDEKKPESGKNLKKVASKTHTKDSTTTESGKKKNKKERALTATQIPEGHAPKPDEIPVHRTDSEPDNNLQLKKTQTETQETSGKGNGETPVKLVTPISTTPAGAVSLTPKPGHPGDTKDDEKKTLTNSDENEAPEKKKS